MYSVLIAEDEMLVRLGLRNSIDWAKFDMLVVADVADGKAALNIYEEKKPDLIITDLKMPIMDGMELISEIRGNDKETKIVILTCLKDFDLVKKAMSYGVSDYILKLTMSENEIESLLGRIHDELDEQLTSKKATAINVENRDVLKDSIFKKYVLYSLYTEDDFNRLVAELKFRITPLKMILCVMDIEQYKKHTENGENQLLKHSIPNLLKKVVDNLGKGEFFSIDDSRYSFLFIFEDSISENRINDDLFSILDNIRKSMQSYFNMSVSFGVSGLFNGYGLLPEKYNHAVDALEGRFFSRSVIFYYGENINKESIISQKINSLLKIPEILGKIDVVFKNEYETEINVIFKPVPVNRQKVCEAICHLIIWIADQFRLSSYGYTDIIISYTELVHICETFDEIIETLRDFFIKIKTVFSKKKVLGKSITEALKFIELNYRRDISLQQVSHHVNLSSPYFSSLFKKEMDMNFIEYLNELRIEKAKELLLKTYLKSYEIAEKAGFSENTYFCRTFKKVTGLSPNGFRKQWLTDWDEEIENENI